MFKITVKLNRIKTMKKYLTIISLFSFLLCFSQSPQKFDYEKHSNPNTNNALSLFFKENVKKKLLKKAAFFKNNKNITLSFYINKEGEPYKLNITSKGTDDYYKAIKNTFKDYFKKNIGLDSLDSRNKYSLQIISKKGNKKIFNCSTKFIVEKPPVCSGCEDLKLYEDLKNCLNLEVKKYFYKNANFNLLNNKTLKNQLNINNEKDLSLFYTKEVVLDIRFSVNADGKLINKKSKVPSFFEKEVSRTLNSFPLEIEPSTLNNTSYSSKHGFNISFKSDKKMVYKDVRETYLAFTKPSTSNDLSLFFKERLKENNLDKANLNRINSNVNINFELDENEKIFNLNTSARSSFLDEKIKAIFKEYSLNKLNFPNKAKFNKYTLQILSFHNNEPIINTNSNVGYERIPIYVGCENSKNIAEAKKCFSKKTQQHFSLKFNADLPNKLGLAPGTLKILIRFVINENGNISKIWTTSNKPNESLEIEVRRVMSLIPKMKSAGIQNGKTVNVTYRIPFTMHVK